MNTTVPTSVYAQRRARMAAQLGPNGNALIPTAPERPRNLVPLIGAWAGSWTGGSTGNVEFRFTKGADGKLGGEATPHQTDSDPYTSPFTSVVLTGNKVVARMSTPDGQATITVEAEITGMDMKGTYAVAGPDGTQADGGAIVAKKKS